MSAGIADPARVGDTVLPDGRRLGWAEWGPPDGTPVVLCPGAATSCWLGFGASDPSPDRTLLDWPADVRALGLGRPKAVGFSQGAPFALALAAAGDVSALAVVSGTDELSHPSFRDALDALRGLVDAAEHDPAALETSMRAMTAETMARMAIEMSGETDRAVYTEPVFAAAFARALNEGLAQGAGD